MKTIISKYYTMKDCFDACGDDDMPFCALDSGEWNVNRLSKKIILEKDCTPASWRYIDSDKWQIKRAEPRVLSMKEIYNSCYEETGSKPIMGTFSRDMLRKADLNGQLREWLSPEQVELRRVAANWRQIAIEKGFGCADLWRVLNNLKPPYEREND
jgi:hypothetical protein